MFRATSIFIVLVVILAAAFFNGGGNININIIPSDATSLAAAQDTAQTLANTKVQSRDLYDLASRLKGQDANMPRVASNTPLNRKVGDQDKFFLSRIEAKEYITITATVHDVTDHAYWYVAAGYQVDDAALKSSADVFEQDIYPTNHQYFGTEWSPGVDGDTHITVLIADIPGVGGYFSSADEYPIAVNPFSNQREMIYIATQPTGQHGSFDFFEGVLAHEFQHMIHWNTQRSRDVWLDEGMAETAMALNGYDIGGTDSVFLNAPDTQLTTWAEGGDDALPHYGASFLFVRYLMEHYGGASMLKALLATPGSSVEQVDAALQKLGYSQNINDVYRDWTVANYLNDKAVGDGSYAYEALQGQADLGNRVIRYPSTYSSDVSEYGADYISLERGTGDVTVSFQGAQEAKILSTNAHSGTHYWYSNRRDNVDTTLTRDFDLSSVSKATLNYWTWFSIEGDYDYGYVEASTDGKSWQTLKGAYTTDTNPNGANYGNGYSGPSGYGPKGTNDPKWVEENLDLSQYAGKKVTLRFEMVTDEAFNAPGWAIDDIKVPEINYSSDAETGDDGWQANGFVRITNTVPQAWDVSAIEYGAGSQPTKVESLEVGANGLGTLNIAGLGSTVAKVVLVVGATAPTTTEKTPYKIEVRRK